MERVNERICDVGHGLKPVTVIHRFIEQVFKHKQQNGFSENGQTVEERLETNSFSPLL